MNNFKEVSEKIKKLGKCFVGRTEFQDVNEEKMEIGRILKFIRMNSLITGFRDEGGLTNENGGPLTNLLNLEGLAFDFR